MLLQALRHLQDWQIPEIQRYCAALTEPFCERIKNLGFAVEDAAWRASHLFGARVRDDIPMERLMNAIDEANISVSTRGTAVRISPNVYNDEADMHALYDVFDVVAQQRAGRSMIV